MKPLGYVLKISYYANLLLRKLYHQRRIQKPCQISKMERFEKIVYDSYPFTIFAKRSILGVCLCSLLEDNVSKCCNKFKSSRPEVF